MAKQKYPSESKKRKTVHINDLNKVNPLTPKQEELFADYRKNPDLSFFLCGSAGTGKTFLAVYLALHEKLEKYNRYETIIIVRSAVPVREIGFTPGGEEEKIANYESPYASICDELFEQTHQYEVLKDIGVIEFHSTSFLKGITLNNCIIIVDESQNLNYQELRTIMTRVGTNSKIIFCGDFKQTDLNHSKYDVSGFNAFFKIVDTMKEYVKIIEFGPDDIVRSPLVKSFILAEEQEGPVDANIP